MSSYVRIRDPRTPLEPQPASANSTPSKRWGYYVSLNSYFSSDLTFALQSSNKALIPSDGKRTSAVASTYNDQFILKGWHHRDMELSSQVIQDMNTGPNTRTDYREDGHSHTPPCYVGTLRRAISTSGDICRQQSPQTPRLFSISQNDTTHFPIHGCCAGCLPRARAEVV